MEETSLLAERSVDKRSAQNLLLEALREHGPGTTLTLQARHCPAFPGSLWKRASELVDSGDAEWTGQWEKNPSGRQARVLAITDQGRARLG